MKRLLYFSLVALLLGACTAPQDKILGSWEDAEGNRLEFHADGSWYSEPIGGSGKIWGTWKIDEESKSLLMRYSQPPAPTLVRQHPFSVSEDKLKINDYKEDLEVTYVYDRVSDAPVSEQAEANQQEAY